MKFLFNLNSAEQTAVSAEESLTEQELANVTGGYGCDYGDGGYDDGGYDDSYDDSYDEGGYSYHHRRRNRRRRYGDCGCDY